MNTAYTTRLSAAFASLAIVASILCGIGALAERPAPSSLFAQASSATVLR